MYVETLSPAVDAARHQALLARGFAPASAQPQSADAGRTRSVTGNALADLRNLHHMLLELDHESDAAILRAPPLLAEGSTSPEASTAIAAFKGIFDKWAQQVLQRYEKGSKDQDPIKKRQAEALLKTELASLKSVRLAQWRSDSDEGAALTGNLDAFVATLKTRALKADQTLYGNVHALVQKAIAQVKPEADKAALERLKDIGAREAYGELKISVANGQLVLRDALGAEIATGKPLARVPLLALGETAGPVVDLVGDWNKVWSGSAKSIKPTMTVHDTIRWICGGASFKLTNVAELRDALGKVSHYS